MAYFMGKRKILDAIREKTNLCITPENALSIKALTELGNRILAGEFDTYEIPKEDPRHDSVYQRLEALEKKHANSDQMIDKRIREVNYRVNVLYDNNENIDKALRDLASRNNKNGNDIGIIDKKVKVLEAIHRDIPPDPENFIAIELGHPFKTIYVRKPAGYLGD